MQARKQRGGGRGQNRDKRTESATNESNEAKKCEIKKAIIQETDGKRKKKTKRKRKTENGKREKNGKRKREGRKK